MAGNPCHIRFSADQQDLGERPHACPQCQRQFRRLEHLQRHVRTHTKERPYPCACGVSFTRRDLLKRHLNIAHSAKEDAPKRVNRDPVENGQPSRNRRRLILSQSEASLDFDLLVDNIDLDVAEQQMTNRAPIDQSFDCQHENPSGLVMGDNDDMLGFSLLQDTTHQPWDVPNMLWEYDTGLGGCTSDDQGQGQQGRVVALLSEPIALKAPAQRMENVIAFPTNRKFVTARLYRRLNAFLAEYTDVLPGFELPSQSRLDRYVQTYFDGWMEHLIFVHEPTLDLENCPPEFVLALATIGAQWRLEQRNTLSLYSASLAIVRRRTMLENPYSVTGPRAPPSLDETYHHLGTCVILLGYATWESPAALSDISILVSIVSSCMQTIGLTEEESGAENETSADWLHWLQCESRRRLCLVAFVSLETLGIAYNFPPALFGSRIGLRLPCDPALWKAASENEWASLRAAACLKSQPLYRDVLAYMLASHNHQQLPDFEMTAQGGYVLIHGLLQRIHLLHEVSAPLMAEGSCLPSVEADRLRAALDLWSFLWDASSKNNRDFSSFVSCTLLSLAHIRIIVDFSRDGRLASREPKLIADALYQHPPFTRDQNIQSALKYATSVLSLTIEIGMDSLARNHQYIAAIRHAVAGFESAVFLSKWLMLIREEEMQGTTVDGRGLTEHESLILSEVRQNLLEACNSVDNPHTVFRWNSAPTPMTWDCKELALGILAVWSRVLKHESSWSILGVMGRSLDAYGLRLSDECN